jgi:hypothetical protein
MGKIAVILAEGNWAITELNKPTVNRRIKKKYKITLRYMPNIMPNQSKVLMVKNKLLVIEKEFFSVN